MQNKFGRKRAMLMINMVYVISAAIIVPYAHDDLGVDPSDENGYMWFWTGRFVAGLASGGALAVTPAYLGNVLYAVHYFIQHLLPCITSQSSLHIDIKSISDSTFFSNFQF